MFRSSITKFLITALGILMTGLFVAVLTLACQTWMAEFVQMVVPASAAAGEVSSTRAGKPPQLTLR